MPVIKLQSCDGKDFTLDVEIAKRSGTIKNMLEDLGMSDEDEAIPLPNVSGKTLGKVIEWAIHHKDDPMPTADSDGKQKTGGHKTEWNKKFFKQLEQPDLFDVILAANYLDMADLFDASCCVVAEMMEGNSVENIRQKFCIANDHTPDEDERLRIENQWCEN